MDGLTMAQIDPSIILQAGRGVTPLKDPSEIADEQAQRQMRQLQVQTAQQGISDDQAYRQALQSGVQGDALVSDLQKRGLGKQAMDYQKFQTEQQKAQGDRGKTVAEGMKNGAAMILANPTEENAIQTLSMAQQQYGLPANMIDGAKAQIYAARNDPNKLKQLAVGWGGDAEKVLGKFQSVNMGGTQETQRVNPITGELQVAGVQARTQSPDSVASVGQSAANAAMTDARARELNATRARGNLPSGYEVDPDKPGALRPIAGGPADPLTKPAGGKPLNDTQAKALQFGTRMQATNAIFDELADKGVNTSLPGSRAGYGIGAMVNALQPEDRQRLDQAKRDFINAVLRRESGAAISPSEFESAELQYFPQPGEGEGQRAQKKAARERSMRGILAEVPDAESRVAQVLGTAAPTAAPAAAAAPKGPQPKQKAMNIGGQDVMAELAPDGKYYVQKGGKWFEVR
jgi:hypothetical protein